MNFDFNVMSATRRCHGLRVTLLVTVIVFAVVRCWAWRVLPDQWQPAERIAGSYIVLPRHRNWR